MEPPHGPSRPLGSLTIERPAGGRHGGPRSRLVMSWWEAVVVAVKGETITLRWRDFPEEPTIKRKRNQIAFLPDGYVCHRSDRVD